MVQQTTRKLAFGGEELNRPEIKYTLQHAYINPLLDEHDIEVALDFAVCYLMESAIKAQSLGHQVYMPVSTIPSIEKLFKEAYRLAETRKGDKILYSVELTHTSGSPPNPLLTVRSFESDEAMESLMAEVEANKHRDWQVFGLDSLEKLATREVLLTLGLYVPQYTYKEQEANIAIPYAKQGEDWIHYWQRPGNFDLNRPVAPIIGIQQATTLNELLTGKAQYENQDLARAHKESLNEK